MPTETPARTIIRVSSISELIVGCPAKVRHIQAGRERPQHWTAARGTAMHAAMGYVMSERMEYRDVSLASTRDHFSGVWAIERDAVEDWSFDGGVVRPAEVEARTLEMLGTLYLATRDVRPVVVEQTFFWDIPAQTDDPDEELYTLQGTPDCPGYYRNFGLIVHDWKSAAKPWGRYKKAHQWQHMGYLLLLHHNRPDLCPRRFWWWSVDEKTGEVQRIEHIYAENAVAEAERQVIGAIRQLSADYLPTKNDPDMCKFCDFRPAGC